METDWWEWVSPNRVTHIVPGNRPCATCGKGHKRPVDAELFKQTAPHWNCITYPGDGMHYLSSDGGCRWCGATKAEIAKEREAKGNDAGSR